MPHRVNTTGDIGNAKVASDSYDVDNIFLTDEGWVYRHYKNTAKTKFWDEIIVAGEVDETLTINGTATTPVDEINDATPTFETGDSKSDIEYAPGYNSSVTPPASPTLGTVTITGATTAGDATTETYSASIDGTSVSVTYTIASADSNDTISGMDVTFSGVGDRVLTVTATDAAATPQTATGTITVTVS